MIRIFRHNISLKYSILATVFFFLLTLKSFSGSTLNGKIKIPLGLKKTKLSSINFYTYYELKRPEIAIALSGGGARGLAQIGVLKVLEKHGIPLDGIAGTSIGGVIGALYCTGYSSAEIESLAFHINWYDIIHDNPERNQLFLGQKEDRAHYIVQLRLKGFSLDIPNAITSGQKFTTMITRILLDAPYPPVEDFEKLHIPLQVVTTDLITGKKVIIKSGSLPDALSASMAIPLLFAPVRINGHLLVDGGLVQNLPVDEARSYDTDLVIAVNTCSELRDENSINAPWEIADQVTTIMQNHKVKRQIQSADISIEPELKNITNTDFDKIREIIDAGTEAADKAVPLIKDILLEKSSTSLEDTAFYITKIMIKGCKNLKPENLLQKTNLDINKPVKKSEIIWAGRSLLQTGFLNNIEAWIDTSDSSISFIVAENPYITNIKIHGNTLFTDSQLKNILITHTDAILNNQDYRNDMKSIMNLYHKNGYSIAEIDSVHLVNGSLNIFINEGRISRITLSGNKRTRAYVINRELPFKAGDFFHTSKIKQGLDNIYSTGYFKYVRLGINKSGNENHLILNLKERSNRLLRFGFRYDLTRRSQGFLQIVEENIFGFGGKGAFFGLIGYRDQVIQAKLWSERLLNSLLTYRLNLYSDSHKFYYYKNLARTGEYKIDRTGGSVSIGRQMQRLGTVSLSLTTKIVTLRSLKGNNIAPDKFTLSTLTLQSEVDTRDKMPFPHKGKYHILKYETAGDFLASEIAFVKLFSSLESYIPITSSFNFHPKISWGFADLTTPFIKKFRIGGMDSFMGLPPEALTGKLFICINTEFRTQIPWPKNIEWYLSLRYDFGGIWNRYTDLSVNDFIQGTGALISLNTPLGPIHFGYGSMSEGINKYYFSAGYKF